MKPRRLLPLFLLLIFAFVFVFRNVSYVRAQQPKLRYIVIFRNDISGARGRNLISAYSAVWQKNLNLINAASFITDPETAARLSQHPWVTLVEPDIIVSALETDNIPFDKNSAIYAEGICDYIPWWSGCRPTPTPTPKPVNTPIPTLTPTSTPASTPTPVTATPTSTPIPQTPMPTNTPVQQPTNTVMPTVTPTGSSQTVPWGISKISAPQSWAYSKGQGIKVAVIDSGIDRDHPDLKDNLAGCINFIYSWLTCEDDNGHGTHVSGIIAAKDNNLGVVGVAPEAKIYSLKVLNRNGQGYLSDIIEAIDWSVSNKMQVINMSLGASTDSTSFHNAVIKARNSGIIEVVAAGNSGPGSNTVTYPAKYPEVVAVSATDASDGVPSWSSRGPEVDIAAPGNNINSTYKGNTYTTMSGTSMSAPHVTGAFALLTAYKPGLSINEYISALLTHADTLPLDPTLVGSGRLNVYNALTSD